MKEIIGQLELEPKYHRIIQEIIYNEHKWRELYFNCAYLLCKKLSRLTYLKGLSIEETAKLLIQYYKIALSEGSFFDYFYKSHIALDMAANES